MANPRPISQRDLRLHSKDIMDAVERGGSFTVTRDGREIAELIPIRESKTFLPRDEFVALGRGIGRIDERRFQADLDAVLDPGLDDPYAR